MKVGINMKYQNPVVRGMYPDPSICRAGDKYYMVCSSMMYFPAVPLFESEDMVNWKQIGHCLTRESQIDLTGSSIYSGVFAPTIRYNNGRFYMITTASGGCGNFYVYTDDIYGEWSEPILVKHGGIDPSLYFEDDKSYFIGNGHDEGGACVMMAQIDLETGELLHEMRPLWHGTGGRFLEGPHLYKFGDWYYLLESEGGTEYGHMLNYARSKSMWGPYEAYPKNPVLTNRNAGGYILQGAGHGDILEDKNGNWWCMHLAYRQTGFWNMFHNLGRESCLVPVKWDDDGWFTVGDGVSRLEYDLDGIEFAPQERSYTKTFADTANDWCFIRNPKTENYEFTTDSLTLTGTSVSLFDNTSPTFAGLRQCEMEEDIEVTLSSDCREAGITLFMHEQNHYDLYLDDKGQASLRINIGFVSTVLKSVPVNGDVKLEIKADANGYNFYAGGIHLGWADTKYICTEVTSGFTGVIIGLYAVDENGRKAEFTELKITHHH